MSPRLMLARLMLPRLILARLMLPRLMLAPWKLAPRPPPRANTPSGRRSAPAETQHKAKANVLIFIGTSIRVPSHSTGNFTIFGSVDIDLDQQEGVQGSSCTAAMLRRSCPLCDKSRHSPSYSIRPQFRTKHGAPAPAVCGGPAFQARTASDRLGAKGSLHSD